MPDSPADFANRYLNILVSTLPDPPNGAGGLCFIAARNYRNRNHHNLSGFGRGLYEFLVRMAHSGYPGLTEAGGAISYHGVGAPILPLTEAQICTPFDGKGSPELFRQVLQLASLWVARSDGLRSRDHTIHTLQDFADKYIGLDCNGFVCAYFLSVYPSSAGARHSYIPTFREAGFHQRISLKTVRSCDVLLPARTNDHIALVSSVSNPVMRNGQLWSIDCVIAESAGEGNPQHPFNGVQYGQPQRLTATDEPGVFHGARTPPKWGGVKIYAVDGVPPQQQPF